MEEQEVEQSPQDLNPEHLPLPGKLSAQQKSPAETQEKQYFSKNMARQKSIFGNTLSYDGTNIDTTGSQQSENILLDQSSEHEQFERDVKHAVDDEFTKEVKVSENILSKTVDISEDVRQKLKIV